MKKLMMFSTLTVMTLISGALLFGNNSQANVESNHDVKKLAEMNIVIEPPATAAKIDSKMAIDKAKAKHPEWATKAKDVKVEHQLLTNKDWQLLPKEAFDKNPDLKAKGHPEKLPVYIVSFQGLAEQPHGTPMNFKGTPPAPTTEWNVVLDAGTGEPLMTFTYR